MEVYKEIRRLRLEGETSQRTVAKRLGISRNTVKKYWDGETVPWERKPYTREPVVMTEEIVQFITECLDEDDREGIRKQRPLLAGFTTAWWRNTALPAANRLYGIWFTT